ncbi:hypothetical protein [Nocardia gipuzkoensis]
MATLSVKTIAAGCLGRTQPLSLKRDVFGVYGTNNQIRSLKAQLDLIRTRPFVRLAIVTIRPAGSTQGQYQNLQRDLDVANEAWQRDCGAWIYCVGSIIDNSGLLGTDGVLNQNGCPLGEQDDPTDEEEDLFDLGRNLGADVVGYFITGSTNPRLGGCSAYPEGRRGFWSGFNQSQNMFAHELTHVIGLNPHPDEDDSVPDGDQNNLMWPTPGAITNPPPDLRDVQCRRIRDDDNVQSC